ncbi:proteasome subunit beta type 1 [Cavenderia fasciculata]|uniref:Proteasome subunit beta n=1 Tax=Cavenderia fasciculata TaxID=261658 RepID=F4Q6R2_CACFS|nr:proteasome subunit beta type 1 [Cavenderia fasciculata]EGG16572.1 proteasome subunit beta type 1 [Cavenderia fasciculata]|eukprot:XP_004354972.1 proteasome subunit beta type 1 [Cavenderia fasciculata]
MMMDDLKLTALPEKEVPISHHRFEPYVDNGGTVLAVAGSNYCIVAGDTRMSDGGYGIQTRHYTKVFKLTDKCVIATSGMQADTIALRKRLDTQLRQYERDHGKSMSTPAIAQFLSNTLYHKRFFPFYTFNLVAGVDEDGIGCVWTYDAVGSHERVRFSSQGSGNQLIQPLLDNQVGKFNQQIVDGPRELSAEQALSLVKDAITSAGERDIYTGDFADIVTIDQKGVHFEKFDLKLD